MARVCTASYLTDYLTGAYRAMEFNMPFDIIFLSCRRYRQHGWTHRRLFTLSSHVSFSDDSYLRRGSRLFRHPSPIANMLWLQSLLPSSQVMKIRNGPKILTLAQHFSLVAIIYIIWNPNPRTTVHR